MVALEVVFNLLYLQIVRIRCHCLCMDIKGHHQALVSQFQGLIGTSFHYLESVGKYNEAYQTSQSLEIGE